MRAAYGHRAARDQIPLFIQRHVRTMRRIHLGEDVQDTLVSVAVTRLSLLFDLAC